MFRIPWQCSLGILFTIAALVGCGSTKSRMATEQLLVSDAVDDAVSNIDFHDLAGRKVFFDAQYVRNVKGAGFVNAEYIISSLRQQMIAADCRLVESHADAEIIAEARVGTLGADGTEVVFGVPASSSLSAAATLVPSAPAIPTIPEISFARRDGQTGAAKIAVFAYERESGRPIWQSGISRSRSTAQDFWLLGAGPFQNGSIHKSTRFAGNRLPIPVPIRGDRGPAGQLPAVAYDRPHVFADPAQKKSIRPVQQASFDASVAAPSADEPDAKPIQLWDRGGNIVTPLEEQIEQAMGDLP